MLDATSLARTITGIESYTKNLLEHMIHTISKEDQLIVLLRNNNPYINQTTPPNVVFYISPFKSQLLTEQIWIPLIKFKNKPDIIHFPAFPPSFLVSSNIIFTVHDATMWKYPETLSRKNKLYMKPLSKRGIKKAKTILTVSEYSKKELSKVFPLEASKISNTGISIDPKRSNKEDITSVKKKYNIESEFFLTVGSLEPRKNLIFLIRSFIEYVNRNQDDNVSLVITGRKAWGAEEIKEIIDDAEMQKRIILTGYINDAELDALYGKCKIFIFPSLYEGFGLPVLEALSNGAAVLSSDRSSLPEVAGEAAVYFSPEDSNDLISKIKLLSEDENLVAKLKEKGLTRSKLFSWNIVSEKIYETYKRL